MFYNWMLVALEDGCDHDAQGKSDTKIRTRTGRGSCDKRSGAELSLTRRGSRGRSSARLLPIHVTVLSAQRSPPRNSQPPAH